MLSRFNNHTTDYFVVDGVLVAKAITDADGTLLDNVISEGAQTALENFPFSHPLLVIDFSDVTKIDRDSILNLFAVCSVVAKRGGSFSLCSMESEVQILITMNTQGPQQIRRLHVCDRYFDNVFSSIADLKDPARIAQSPLKDAGGLHTSKKHDRNTSGEYDIRSLLQRLGEKEQDFQPSTEPTTRAESLAAMLATISEAEDYPKLSNGLKELSHDFRLQIAARLEPALNAHIRAMPHDTYEEKKTLAKWVNDEVEPFGLAIKCPKTGLPAKLRGQPGNWPEIGRFAFEVYVDGKRTTPSTSDKLPELMLTDATPAKVLETLDLKPETPWQDEVGQQSTRRGRIRS